jgi:outer membrane protein, multidrug efflux system
MRKILLLTPLVLAGCASGPAYQPPPVAAPATFREAPAAVTAARQADSAVPAARPAVAATGIAWRSLGDTTLDRLMDEVRRANLDIRAAEARVRNARSVRTGAALDLAPTVTVAGGYTRQRLSNAVFPIGGGTFPDQDIWDAGFDASWEIDLFGRLRRNLQAEGAFVAVAEEDLRDVRVSLEAELARAYFDLRGGEEQLAVVRRNADNQRHTLDLTRERLEAGRGTAFDTERAQAQLSFTLASIPTLESRVAAAQYRIGVLVGRPPAAVATELAASASSPLPALPDSLALANADSLVLGRPDVARAERQLAAQRALVSAARADYLPRLTLGGSAGYSAAGLGQLGDAGTFRYAIGPVISWPALNLGRVKARVDQSRARADAAKAEYGQTVLAAQEDVENALSRYSTALTRVRHIAEAAAASAHASELARLRFTEGVADFLQVLDAERTQLEAEGQLAQSRTEAATAYAALFKALGGKWPGQ